MSGLFEGLRQNLRKLKADGEDGFEGLMAAVLTELTGRSYAIANSGSQNGRDGQSSLDRGAIVFEAKRYEDSLPKEKILTKIAEMRVASKAIDLWRHAVLLAKIVDGRFDWSEVNGEAPTELVRRFGPTLDRSIRQRIGKWKSKRNSKLFGMNAPDPVFLSAQSVGLT